jgi:hypothetical protein
MDKIMKIDNEFDVKVTGIYEDFPTNSTFADLHFISTWELLFNKSDWMKTMEDPWGPIRSCYLSS